MTHQRAILRFHFHHGGNEDLYHQLLTLLDGISPRWQPQPPAAADHDVTGALKYFDRSPRDLAQLIALRAAALYGTQTTIGGGNSRIRPVRGFPHTSSHEPTGLSHLLSYSSVRLRGEDLWSTTSLRGWWREAVGCLEPYLGRNDGRGRLVLLA